MAEGTAPAAPTNPPPSTSAPGPSATPSSNQAQQAEDALQQSAYEQQASSPLNEFESLLVELGVDEAPEAPVTATPPRTEDGGQRTVDDGAPVVPAGSEDGEQTAEDGGAEAEDGGQKTEDGAEAADGAEAGEEPAPRNRTQERIDELTREKHEWREKSEQLEARLAQLENGAAAQANLLEQESAGTIGGGGAAVAGQDPYAQQIANREKVAELVRQYPNGYQEGQNFYGPEQLELAARTAERDLVGLKAQQAVWQSQQAQVYAAQESQFRNVAADKFPFLTRAGSPEHQMARQIMQQAGETFKKFPNWPVAVGILAKGLVEFNQAQAAGNGTAGANNTGAAGGMTAAGQHRNGNPAPVPGAGPNPQQQTTSPRRRTPRAPQVGAGAGSGAPRTSSAAARAHGDPMQALVEAAGQGEDAELSAIMNALPG